MNATAHARASAATLQAQRIPVLKSSQLFSDSELAQTRFFANLPHRAQAVVDYLAPQAKYRKLDTDLSSILRTAQATLNRSKLSAASKVRFN